MTALLALRPGPLPWQLDAIPYTYDEAARAQFKAMPGITWVPDRTSENQRGFYRGPREAVNLVVHTLEAAGVLRLRDGVPGLPAPVLGSLGASKDLRSYQIEGAQWLRGMLATTGAALLADDMGIGKSVQALVALESLPLEGSILVVCPASVVTHWLRQIQRWGADPSRWIVVSYEGFCVAVTGGSKPDRKGRRKIEPLPATLAGCVLDEIHYFANAKAKRTRAFVAFRALHPGLPLVGLSGTPMTTRPRDLWQPLDILWPGRFGRAGAFQKRYCDGHQREIPNVEDASGNPLVRWDADGVSRSEELAERLRACMLRRTKAEVALELPPRSRVTIDVVLPPKALKDLQRAALAIDWQTGRQGIHGASVSSLLSNVESYKLDAALELARDVMASGQRPLLLTTRRETARQLGDALGAPVASGDVEPRAREALLQDAPCGVATIYAVTTGIDLVSYDVIIFTGLDWVPSTLLQAEARIHRLGQRRPVTIYYLIGAHTLDEVVRERVIERLDTFATLMGGDGTDGMALALGGKDDETLLGDLVRAMQDAA